MTLIRTFRRAMLKVLMCTVASAYNVHSLSCILLFGRHAVHAGAVSGIQMCRRHVGLPLSAAGQSRQLGRSLEPVTWSVGPGSNWSR